LFSAWEWFNKTWQKDISRYALVPLGKFWDNVRVTAHYIPNSHEFLAYDDSKRCQKTIYLM
jgi:hypothetical protein